MASFVNIPIYTVTAFVIILLILIVSQEVETRGSRGGGRFSSSRFSSTRFVRTRYTRVRYPSTRIRYPSTRIRYPSTRIRYPSTQIRYPSARVRYPSTRVRYPSTQVRYPSTRIRYPSTRIRYPSTRIRTRIGSNSLAWQAGIVAGTYYGSRSYMRRRRWFNKQEPRYCRNYYKKDANDTVYGVFICPMEWDDDDMVYCCGSYGRQYCCDDYGSSSSNNYHGSSSSNNYHGSSSSNSFYIHKESKLSGGQIAGIVIGVIIFTVIIALLVYCICLRNRGSTRGTVLNRMMNNQSKKEFGMQPSSLSEPAPLPSTKYVSQPQGGTIVHPTAGNVGMYQDNAAYCLQPEFIPGAPPGNTPNVPPPSYDTTMGAQPVGQPYPPPAPGAYPIGVAPFTVSNGQPYPPAPQ